MTGFEILPTPNPINEINHLHLQIAAKLGKLYANPQPAATRPSREVKMSQGLRRPLVGFPNEGGYGGPIRFGSVYASRATDMAFKKSRFRLSGNFSCIHS